MQRTGFSLLSKLAGILIVIFATSFAVATALGWTDEATIAVHLHDLAAHAPIASAAVVVIALVADLLLPVPSSVVMVVAGWLGGAWLGTLLGPIGQMGGAWLGYVLARHYGRPWVAARASEGALAEADTWMGKYGGLVVVLSRPVPMMTETVSCLAGATNMPLRPYLGWSLAGTLPTAAVYAFAGSHARDVDDLGWALWAAIGVPVVGWIATAALRAGTHRTA